MPGWFKDAGRTKEMPCHKPDADQCLDVDRGPGELDVIDREHAELCQDGRSPKGCDSCEPVQPIHAWVGGIIWQQGSLALQAPRVREQGRMKSRSHSARTNCISAS